MSAGQAGQAARQQATGASGRPGVPKRCNLLRRESKAAARKNLRSSLKRFNVWCKQNRHVRLPELFKQLNAKLRGYFNYYGVTDNFPSLKLFFYKAMRLLVKYLNRRSQRGSNNLAGFVQLIEQFGIVKPYITRRPKHYNGMRVAPVMA
jgi:hypothetical protein